MTISDNLSNPKNKHYQYSAFGLNILSAIELPELIPEDVKKPDIKISFGEVPHSLENPNTLGVRFQITHDSFLLKKDSIARYLVLDGNKIIIEKAYGASDEDIRLFLLTSVVGAVLQQRGLFPLHASTVKVGNECIVFCGNSGNGKSTIARGFIKRGYSLHADDISVVKVNNKGLPVVFSGYPQLKLWEDVLLKFEKDTAAFCRVRPVLDKFFVPAGVEFCTSPLTIKKIYILSPWNKKEIEISDINGIEKFKVLKRQTYRLKFSNGLGKAPDQFKLAGVIAKQVPVSIIRRPRKPFLLEDLIDRIEMDLK